MELLINKLKLEINVQKDVYKRLKKLDTIKNTEIFYFWFSYLENQIIFGKELYNYLKKVEILKKQTALVELFQLLTTNQNILDAYNSKSKIYVKEKIM